VSELLSINLKSSRTKSDNILKHVGTPRYNPLSPSLFYLSGPSSTSSQQTRSCTKSFLSTCKCLLDSQMRMSASGESGICSMASCPDANVYYLVNCECRLPEPVASAPWPLQLWLVDSECPLPLTPNVAPTGIYMYQRRMILASSRTKD
jgi:hypothetical protein